MGKSNKINSKKKDGDKDTLLHLSLEFYATFYPKYYLLETTLKNRLYSIIRERLGENWFTDQLVSSKENNLFKLEADVILRRKPRGFKLKDKGLLVESGLGIWVEFFNKKLYKDVNGLPISIFPKLPAHIKRKELYQKLGMVKELRNQLFHYRISPITSLAQLKNLDLLLVANKELINLLEWLDVSTSKLASKEFEKKVNQIRKVLA